MLGKDEIENRFGFHKAAIEGPHATGELHKDVRLLFKEFASVLDRIVPDGRYKDLMVDDLERASMWTHKAVAQKAPLIDE